MPHDPQTCSECGEVKLSKAGLASHIRFKHTEPKPTSEIVAELEAVGFGDIPNVSSDEVAAEVIDVTPGAPGTPEFEMPEPASVPSLRDRTAASLNDVYSSTAGKSMYRVARTIKMVKPICNECKFNTGARFFETCPHNPYFSIRYAPPPEKVVQDPDGTFRIEKTDKLVEVIVPNLRQVPADVKVSSGRTPAYALEHGYKLTQDFGLPQMCEFNNCWSTDLKHRTAYGSYCSEQEAKLISARSRGRSLPVPQHPKRNELIAGLTM